MPRSLRHEDFTEQKRNVTASVEGGSHHPASEEAQGRPGPPFIGAEQLPTPEPGTGATTTVGGIPRQEAPPPPRGVFDVLEESRRQVDVIVRSTLELTRAGLRLVQLSFELTWLATQSVRRPR